MISAPAGKPLTADAEFRKLWIGQTISEIGSRISREGLPLTAVLVLGVTPAQMGVLSALSGGSALVFSLMAGVIVDRLYRRPILIWTDIGRAALLSTIPLAAALHALTFTQLLLVATFVGLLSVLFDIAYQSYLPSLVAKEQLAGGNRLLAMAASTAEILGPGLTGILIQTITAPRAILLDAISFLVSAGSVFAIRRPEIRHVAAVQVHWREEAMAGGRVIARHPLLRALALRSLVAFFSMGSLFSLYMLYAIRVLHMSTVALGFTIAAGGVGSLAGAYFAEKISRAMGTGRAFLASAFVAGSLNLLIPLAASFPAYAVLFLGMAQLFGDAAWSVYFVNEVTLRQRAASAEVLGRVNAAMLIASRGILPIGALAAGLLANKAGVPATLWVGSIGLLLSCVFLWPVRGYRS